MSTKIWFSDFWSNWDQMGDPVFGKTLFERFDLVLDPNSDILVFNVFGTSHISSKAKVRVLHTSENFFAHPYEGLGSVIGPDVFRLCNFAITAFDLPNPNNFRMPNYIRKYGYASVAAVKTRTVNSKSKDMLYLYRNPVAYRDDLGRQFMQHFQVDAPGQCLNNMKFTVPADDKLLFMANYRFILAFENSKQAGYSTEKLYDCFLSGTMPIYVGDPTVTQDFNSETFLHVSDYSFDDLITKIKSLRGSDTYYNMLLKNPIKNDALFDGERFNSFFSRIVDAAS